MVYTKTMMKKFYSMSLQTKCYENVANFQVVIMQVVKIAK